MEEIENGGLARGEMAGQGGKEYAQGQEVARVDAGGEDDWTVRRGHVFSLQRGSSLQRGEWPVFRVFGRVRAGVVEPEIAVEFSLAATGGET